MNKRDRNKYPTIGEMADDIECNQCTYPGVMIKQAVSEFTALLQRQQSDAARWEWLEKQFSDGLHIEGCYSGSFSGGNLKRCATIFYGSKEIRGDSLIEVIDAARDANTRLKEGRNECN